MRRVWVRGNTGLIPAVAASRRFQTPSLGNQATSFTSPHVEHQASTNGDAIHSTTDTHSASPNPGAATTPAGASTTPGHTLYPRVRMRAKTERPAPPLSAFATDEGDEAVFVESGSVSRGTGAADAVDGTSGVRLPRSTPGTWGDTAGHVATPHLQKKTSGSRPRMQTGTLEEEQPSPQQEAGPSHASATVAPTDATSQDSLTASAGASSAVTGQQPELNEVQSFLEAVQQQVEHARWKRNQAIPYPEHPDTLVPLFRRVKRHTKMQLVEEDPDYPTFARKDAFVALPPTGSHPWVKNTPIGHVIHGDGQLGVVGTGEVGFEDTRLQHKNPSTGEADDENESGSRPNVDKFEDEATLRKERRGWRGLQHQSILHRTLPQNNGKVLQDAVIKHSFTLTGRGVFATREIKKGETIMIVESSAQSVGVKGEIRRLEDMVADILLATYEGCYPEDAEETRASSSAAGRTPDQPNGEARSSSPSSSDAEAPLPPPRGDLPRNARPITGERGAEMKAFLHDWILTGQPSSLLEHWPRESTQRVLDTIGGRDVLDALELHTIHIARLAATIDLNSFLVESFYAERKGMAYFPEAGFLNHSCMPNADYDIIPEHTFMESDYYLDEMTRDMEGDSEDRGERENAAVHGEATPAAATPRATDQPNEQMQPPRKEREAEDSVAEETGLAPSQDTGITHVPEQINYLRHFSELPDLTESGAPRFLFCCRAEKDIKAGEEILISYIPPGWSFDNRQYVLHDRYHFWCKCPKCAPVLEQKYARIPRFLVGIVVVSLLLQAMLLYQRDRKNDVDEELNRLNAMSEEERIEELRARGIDVEDLSMDAKVREREHKYSKGRAGLFELLEREKLRRAYDIDGPLSPNEELMESQNPYPRKPFGL